MSDEQQAQPTGLDILFDTPDPIGEDGSSIWYAVVNPRAVRNQPMALFRTATDARLVGGKMTIGEIQIIPVRITVPPAVRFADAPSPSVTIVVSD